VIVTLRRFQFLILSACLAGYAWVFFILFFGHSKRIASFEVCLFKNISTIPCPSCGSTRSVLALLNGRFLESLLINPLGIIVAFVMLMAPIWILFDFATKGQTFIDFYGRLDAFIKRPGNAIPLALLIIMNWFWTISKGL